jgi:hypothetical protein
MFYVGSGSGSARVSRRSSARGPLSLRRQQETRCAEHAAAVHAATACARLSSRTRPRRCWNAGPHRTSRTPTMASVRTHQALLLSSQRALQFWRELSVKRVIEAGSRRRGAEGVGWVSAHCRTALRAWATSQPEYEWRNCSLNGQTAPEGAAGEPMAK